MENLIGQTLTVSSRRGKDTYVRNVKVLSIENEFYVVQDLLADIIFNVQRETYDKMFLNSYSKTILPKHTKENELVYLKPVVYLK